MLKKITTSKQLAIEMARLTKKLRENINSIFKKEIFNGPLHKLFNNFKQILIKDLNIDIFIDIYTQTIAISLFSAKFIKKRKSSIENIDDISELFLNTNPFLKNLFKETIISESDSKNVTVIKDGILELNNLFSEQNIEVVLQEFKNQDNREDPIIHFYEIFLKEYGPTQKIINGVFFTPDPVVSFIVRAVDYLLRTELECPEGLADTSKVSTIDRYKSEQDDKFSKEVKQVPKVQILDPATGTGTFPKHIVEQIKKFFDEKYKELNKEEFKKKWNDYISQNLMLRLFGFELLMAPYAVANLRLGLKLLETGYDFTSQNRLGIYLINALDENQEDSIILDGNISWLADESREANNIKFHNQLSVIIGNPPYSGFPANNGEWITDLVHDYYFVDGRPLEEKNPKWLLDDYVKFIRFGQWCINRTGFGILAFITNHGYLDNPTFRGMREHLMKEFPIIYLINLHGNSIKKELAPDGSKDECVFDIKQGVSIGIFIKPIKKIMQNNIHYVDLWGSKEEKFNWLKNNNIDTINWNKLKPNSPFYLFIPQDKDLWIEYMDGLKLTDIFKVYSAGIATARDHFTIQWTKEDMLEILRDFSQLPPEEARKKYNLRKDVRDWKVTFAQKDVINTKIDPNRVVPILYRPFDVRYTYYTGKSRGFLCMPRPEVMQHMLSGENIGLIVSRSVRGAPWRDVLVSTTIIEFGLIATRPGNTAPLFPLYLFNKQKKEIIRDLNLSDEAIYKFSNKLGLEFVENTRGNMVDTFGPEDLFHYIYAILYSQNYRDKYAEFLKIDFPYIPITKNIELFKKLSALGADLVALHTFNDKYEATSWNQRNLKSPFKEYLVEFVEGINGKEVGRFNTDCYQNGKLFIDENKKENGSYFIGIPKEIWEFFIGSYQVCYKWMYDKRVKSGKKGKILAVEDIDRFKKIVITINETIRIIKEIDKTIEEYKGLPIN